MEQRSSVNMLAEEKEKQLTLAAGVEKENKG
jgi:hypothetical protein